MYAERSERKLPKERLRKSQSNLIIISIRTEFAYLPIAIAIP
jgi:hypothetical protein